MNSRYHQLILSFITTCVIVNAHAQLSYRDRYADVIAHYAIQAKDSLKYKAALFLIDNMDGHESPEGTAIDDYIYRVGTMKKGNGIHQLQTAWNIASKAGTAVYKPDSTVVSNSYLINNIESAFEAWEKAAWKDEITFSQFCEYILPYRANNEHIGSEWRTVLRQQYSSLIDGVTDMRRAFAIVKDSVFKAVVLSNNYCPYTLDPITCQTIGRAECSQRCILLTAVLRSLGIPTAIDCTPMWADYSNKGHAWVAMITGNGNTYTVYEQDTEAKMHNPIDASQFLFRYRIKEEDHCPYEIKSNKTPVKIYRICFSHCNVDGGNSFGIFASPFLTDVSSKYELSTDIRLKVGNAETIYLCSYLSGSDWEPVAQERSEHGEVIFHHVGRGTVCAVATIRNGKKEFLSYPFLVGENGIERMFSPSETRKQSICVDRKYPLCSYVTDTWGSMKGGTFEASMTKDFSTADTIAIITAMPHGITTLKPISTKQYRYLRYHAPKNNRSSLSELQFYTTDESGKQRILRGKYFADGVDSSTIYKVFDGSLSTICRGLHVGYTIGVALGEGEETVVSEIKFCPSTDLNFVEQGHLYELYYFDTDWHIIGRVYSKKEHLEFENVPVGALLLLKDKSAGKEERIFEYTDGRQIWH